MRASADNLVAGATRSDGATLAYRSVTNQLCGTANFDLSATGNSASKSLSNGIGGTLSGVTRVRSIAPDILIASAQIFICLQFSAAHRASEMQAAFALDAQNRVMLSAKTAGIRFTIDLPIDDRNSALGNPYRTDVA